MMRERNSQQFFCVEFWLYFGVLGNANILHPVATLYCENIVALTEDSRILGERSPCITVVCHERLSEAGTEYIKVLEVDCNLVTFGE